MQPRQMSKQIEGFGVIILKIFYKTILFKKIQFLYSLIWNMRSYVRKWGINLVVFEKKKNVTLLSSMHATVMVMHYEKKKKHKLGKGRFCSCLVLQVQHIRTNIFFFILGFFKKYFKHRNVCKQPNATT
jgi:hypothetical protein